MTLLDYEFVLHVLYSTRYVLHQRFYISAPFNYDQARNKSRLLLLQKVHK